MLQILFHKQTYRQRFVTGSLLVILSAPLSASPRQFFRGSGADLSPPWYSTQQHEHESRINFIKSLHQSLKHRPPFQGATYVDNSTINQRRDEIILFALGNEHLLNGIGTEGQWDLNTYAQLLVQYYRKRIWEMTNSTRWTTAHIEALAALAFTDETLNILELMTMYLPEVSLPSLRGDLNDGLRGLKKIVGTVIPDAHVNGLVTSHLVTFNSTLNGVLRGHHPSQQSIHNLTPIRKDIDSILTSYNVVTPYPTVDINPEAMINQSESATVNESTNCWHWPWPVPGQTKTYLICTQ